jgi:hypothetical protein
LWVSDRANRRLQVFDQDGHFLEQHAEFGAMSAIFIDGNDRLYGADSTSNAKDSPGFSKGIRIINLRSGKIEMTILDAEADPINESGAEGIAVDVMGSLYVTYTDGRGIRKFTPQ